MNNAFFRSEVLATKENYWLGPIRLAQPMSNWLIVTLALSISVLLILFVEFGSYTKKAHVAGITVPSAGSLTIAAPNAGILVHSHVVEGQHVNAGDILFDISTERQGSNGEITALVGQQLAAREQALAAEQRLRIAQDADKKRALQDRLQNLNLEEAQLTKELSLAEQRQALAQQSLSKFELLQKSGFVSVAQTQEKQEALIDIEAKVSELKRIQVQLQATRLTIRSDIIALSTSLESDLSQIQRSQASLQQEIAENQNRKESFITASESGTVTTITYKDGQAVSSGQSLATLIPTDSASSETPNSPNLEVHLYVPSRTAGFLAVGQEVQLRYQAFPYQKFGLQHGVISDVSSTPFAPNELPSNLASTILSSAQQSRSFSS
ncbi:HlyD family efflux transporter periplasmic adaptor subunit [Sapientia aquatica]|uniref:HlyD family efflux transporter periplasmic adaptor subunit n=2 Tax=Sapientia aquatica TaxID=1549640 RepID=A0A4R5VMM7_9BURK|nr:HlyD family efflux transporter periplasmic adaptor subunit [Sapientia aquatica]